MKAAEIRETFLSFFEQRDHLRLRSGSLVPATYDPSVLLTTAGMQPLKPYFLGQETPPRSRLTSCQKCFRTTDIESVGRTARHLTFFEMLGNFSIGDYFKQGAVEYALELSRQLGFAEDDIWVTVFGGDARLGLGPDAEAIECWRAVGIPDERIVHLGREDNFWQSGAVGPCGPCSELYLDRGAAYGGDDDRPGDDTERFLEYWNLVFMQYELHSDGSLTELPMHNIDTGLGLDRLAAILQDVPSVFETDHFRAVIELGEELSGKSYGSDVATTRALRIFADHGRAMTFLLADGVVPSNEERGYILRRVMRRALQQARVLQITEPFLPRLCAAVIETMGDAYPELRSEARTIEQWSASEEESFSRTLAQGERLLDDAVAATRSRGESQLPAREAFRLHDTYGFPFELTKELVQSQGLTVNDADFEHLMDAARERARSAGRRSDGAEGRERAGEFASRAGFATRFVGYESTEQDTVIAALEPSDGHLLAKLSESPFYAEGGGQISDSGVVETPSARARVTSVYRLGDDQALELEPVQGTLVCDEPVRAVVDRAKRLATMANHTATHLLHAALRAQLGPQVRQAGSYVGPDKLRFDFSYGRRLTDAQLTALEDQLNDWILANLAVRAIYTTRAEADTLGAIALFGEKYGDWVRMVEVEGVSRELCGGTHVSSTAEIGVFCLTAETSSAANVRRIEAVTGAEAVGLLRRRAGQLRKIADTVKTSEDEAAEAVQKLDQRVRELSKRPRQTDRKSADALASSATELDGVWVVAEAVDATDPEELLDLSDRVKQILTDAVVVLGTVADGRVHLVANASDSAVDRGVSANAIVSSAGQVAGGGGGGRETMARAGGRNTDKLSEALNTAREAIEQALR